MCRLVRVQRVAPWHLHQTGHEFRLDFIDGAASPLPAGRARSLHEWQGGQLPPKGGAIDHHPCLEQLVNQMTGN
jgi:hypothetical protein